MYKTQKHSIQYWCTDTKLQMTRGEGLADERVKETGRDND